MCNILNSTNDFSFLTRNCETNHRKTRQLHSSGSRQAAMRHIRKNTSPTEIGDHSPLSYITSSLHLARSALLYILRIFFQRELRYFLVAMCKRRLDRYSHNSSDY